MSATNKFVKSYVDWIHKNKEGALIGLAAAIVIFYARESLPFIINPIKQYLHIQTNDILFSALAALGVLIGSLIDSIYKPNK